MTTESVVMRASSGTVRWVRGRAPACEVTAHAGKSASPRLQSHDARPRGRRSRIPRSEGRPRDETHGRQLQPAARPRDRRLSRDPADRRQRAPLRRRGDLRRDPRERARRGRLRGAVDQLSGQRQPDGAADLHRRAAARLGQADHRGDPLLRLCPAGPQARPAHADLGQAGRQPDHRGGRRPGARRSISTPGRSRASSTSRPTTSTPRR